jgi:hypothetical protein
MVRALNSAGITPVLSLKNAHTAACEGLACAPTRSCALPEDDVVAALRGLSWVRFYGECYLCVCVCVLVSVSVSVLGGLDYMIVPCLLLRSPAAACSAFCDC